MRYFYIGTMVDADNREICIATYTLAREVEDNGYKKSTETECSVALGKMKKGTKWVEVPEVE